VPVDQVAQEHADRCARIRSKLMALPTDAAPQIAQATGGDANEIRDLLTEKVTKALEELTQHGAGGDGA